MKPSRSRHSSAEKPLGPRSKIKFSESAVHDFIYQNDWSGFFKDEAILDVTPRVRPLESFELWKVIKQKVMERLSELHELVRNGELVGSKVKLKGTWAKPMELDMLGRHEEGIFVCELKVDSASERNSFTELLGYSQYIAELFAMSGHQDVVNVLIAPLFTQIARYGYLYDLLINDRKTVVYQPILDEEDELSSLRFSLHIPSDFEFRQFANQLISHDGMACAVGAFNLEGSQFVEDRDGLLPPRGAAQLEQLGRYAAQLMEADRLHGFCFVSKARPEHKNMFDTLLYICATNPFTTADATRWRTLEGQLKDDNYLQEAAESGFYGRLITILNRALRMVGSPALGDLDTPEWNQVVKNWADLYSSHNLGFSPTGVFREAFSSYIEQQYRQNQYRRHSHDLPKFPISVLYNWGTAWTFMEQVGLRGDR